MSRVEDAATVHLITDMVLYCALCTFGVSRLSYNHTCDVVAQRLLFIIYVCLDCCLKVCVCLDCCLKVHPVRVCQYIA